MTPRPHWTLGERPSPEHRAVAQLSEGDGWALFWATDAEVDEGFECPSEHIIDWPFDEDECASIADMRGLGFERLDLV